MAKVAMEIGIGAGLAAASFFVPGSGFAIGALQVSDKVAAALGPALLGMGGSMMLSGVSEMMASKPSAGVTGTVKSPVSPHVIVYGRAMVGGTLLYRTENNYTGGTTTSSNKQLHQMFVLAAHPCALSKGYQIWVNQKPLPTTFGTTDSATSNWVSYNETQKTSSISSLSVDSDGVGTLLLSSDIGNLDGTQIQIKNCSPSKLNGKFILTRGTDDYHYTYTAGVAATACTSLGSVATLYPQYSNKLKGQVQNGAQTSTCSWILDCGTDWPATAVGYGYTTAYCQAGYDSSVFSGIPNIQWLIYGKNDILDFRTSSSGWTDNSALIIADYLMLSRARGGFGLSESDLDLSSFKTAANTCDETITLIDGSTESRYRCNGTIMVNKGRGAILQDLLSSCAGRITVNGGKFGLQVGVAQTPVMTLTADMFIGGITYKPKKTITSLFNAVKGTYTSPENLYMPSDYPAYLQDSEHEYSSDQFLAQDGSERIYGELSLLFTQSSAMAQRLAKIHLLRSRYQKTISVTCDMRTYQLVAGDWCYLTFPRYGFKDAQFEVQKSGLVIANNTLAVQLDLQQVDDDIFSFNINEQLTPQGYTYPNASPVIDDPTGLTVYSGLGDSAGGLPCTVSYQSDGTAINSLYVQWDLPTDPAVETVQVQYQLSGSSSWMALVDLNASTNNTTIPHVSTGDTYYVRVRFKTYAGVYSDWVENGGETVSSTYSATTTSTTELDASALTATALSDGTAAISVSSPLTFSISGVSFSVTPSNTTITGLSQKTLYYVYYVDKSFAASTCTLVVTTTQSDFSGLNGYFYVGSITTPSYSTTYYPSTYSDSGSSTTANPAYAYDGNTGTAATVRSVEITTTTKDVD
jgi:hypothetical protein